MSAIMQRMWEDSKTRSKWVVVSQCYFPADLPEGVGRPCAPEINEVSDFYNYCRVNIRKFYGLYVCQRIFSGPMHKMCCLLGWLACLSQ